MPPYYFKLIGYPLGHSLSSILHEHWLCEAGIAGCYALHPIQADGLGSFCEQARETSLSGFNITVPHKEKIIPFLDRLSPQAKRIGAVNTVQIKEGQLIGYNTDSLGFLKPLQEKGYKPYRPALIIGAGGAARAVLAGLLLTDCPLIMVMNRHQARAQNLVDELGSGRASVVPMCDQKDAVAAAGLIVNATSLGTARFGAKSSDQDRVDLDIDLSLAASDTIIYDLVYNPLETAFIKQARARGLFAFDGLEMLIAQGAEAFRIWTGHKPNPQSARAVLKHHLKRP